ncbi:hypothetical protein BH11PSE3_BH11PSE3_11350 [soil metagenome]
MYKIVLTAALALCVAGPAGAQSGAAGTPPGAAEVQSAAPKAGGGNAKLSQAASTQSFVTKASQGDMLELASSKLAAEKGGAKAKDFASRMIKDHTATTAELQALVSSGKVKAELPSAMDKEQSAKVDKLGTLSGAAFDKAYQALQVAAHKEAVPLFETYSVSGDNAELQAFAGKALPHLQQHLKMAEDLDK